MPGEASAPTAEPVSCELTHPTSTNSVLRSTMRFGKHMRFSLLAPLMTILLGLSGGVSDARAEQKKAPDAPTSSDLSPRIFDRIHAVPKKRMLKQMRVELSGHIAGSLNDAYFHQFSAGGELIFYPLESFGIGVSGDYFVEQVERTSLEWVRKGYLSSPATYASPLWSASMNLYWLPVDGKFSLFDSFIGYFDLYAGVGGGVVATSADALRPAVTASIGQHFVLADFLTVRVELRDLLYFDEHQFLGENRSSVRNQVMLRLGFGLFIPPSFEYRSP